MFRAEGISHYVAHTVHQWCSDDGKGAEESSVTIADVGERDGIVIAPGREYGRHLESCGYRRHTRACKSPNKRIAEEAGDFASLLIIFAGLVC